MHILPLLVRILFMMLWFVHADTGSYIPLSDLNLYRQSGSHMHSPWQPFWGKIVARTFL